MDSHLLTEIKKTSDYLSKLVNTASNGSVASSKKTQKKCNHLSMRPEKAVKQITWKSKSQDSQGNEKEEDRNAKVKSKTLKTDTNSVRTDKGSSKPIENKDSDDSGDSDESESDYDTSSTDGTE